MFGNSSLARFKKDVEVNQQGKFLSFLAKFDGFIFVLFFYFGMVNFSVV